MTLATLLLLAVHSVFAETVTLKDGSVYHGTLRKADPSIVELETADGVLSIAKERILTIDYSKSAPPSVPKREAAPEPVAPKAEPAPAAVVEPVAKPEPAPAARFDKLDAASPAPRKGRFALGLEIFGPANSHDHIKDDFNDGAAAVAGAGYTVNGELKTKSAVGFRPSYMRPVSPSIDLGGSIGLISGPDSEGTLNVSAPGRTGTLGLRRYVQWVRFMLETRARFDLSERSALRLGAGIGLANGRATQEVTCVGTACVVPSGIKQNYSANWTGFSWEVSPDFTYRSLVVGLKFAGFPSYKGSNDISKIEWVTTGFHLGFMF